jgi:amino acid transporter
MAITAAATARPVVADNVRPRYLEWGPIILGALGVLAIMIVLLTFGAALGLSAVSPHPYAGLSGTVLAILAALYGALAHVASFSAGGYLAGRMRSPWVAGEAVEQHFRDGSHGFAVWALGVVVGAASSCRASAAR